MDTTTSPDLSLPAASPAAAVRRAILALALVAVLVMAAIPAVVAVFDWRLPDNDDAMRVAQVRDWLAGQAWFDVRQHRFAPLDDGDMHWSRLADLPMALVALLAMPLLGSEASLKLAAFVTPPLLGLITCVLAVRTAMRLAPPGSLAVVASITVPMCLLAFPSLTWFMPGRVDHHGLQLLALMTAVAGLAGGRVRGAALAGLAVATSLLVGLETAPVLVVVTGFVALRWLLRGTAVRSATIAFALALGIGLAALFAATIAPERWLVRHHDAFSLIHLAPALVGAAGLAVAAAMLRAEAPLARWIAAALIGVAVVAAALPFPELLRSPYSQVDPMLREIWLSRVGETFSAIAGLQTGQPHLAIAFGVPAVLASGAACFMAWRAWRTGSDRLDLWLLLAALLLVTTVLAWVWQLRVSGQAALLGSIAVAACLAWLLETRGTRAFLIGALALSPLPSGAVGAVLASQLEADHSQAHAAGAQGPDAATPATAQAAALPGQCTGTEAFSSLTSLTPMLAVTSIDVGAPMLLATPHTVLAAPYHRNNRSLRAAYDIFLAPPAQAEAKVRALGAGLIVTCTGAAEVDVLAQRAPGGLMAVLEAGRVPGWLAPLPSPQGSDIRAWRVLPPRQGQ